MKTAQSSNRKVFVGSVPGYFTSSDVAYFIEPFGDIKNIRLDLKSRDPHLNRGFCILTMRYPRDAAKLLKQRQIYIGNSRHLICKPYLQGNDLQSELLLHDQRRVILKHLPHNISEKDIKLYFEQTVGPVELVFIFQTDDQSLLGNLQSRRKRTASVTFCHASDASAIFTEGVQEFSVNIWGIEIRVQKFKYQPPEELHPQTELNSEQSSPQSIYLQQNSEFYHMSSRSLLKVNDRQGSLNFSEKSKNLNHRLNSCLVLRTLDHEEPNMRFNLVLKRNPRHETPGNSENRDVEGNSQEN